MKKLSVESVLLSELMQLRKELEQLTMEVEILPLAPGALAGAWSPLLDMTEDEEDFHLELELPGVRPEDIDIQFLRNQLVITGGRRERQGEGCSRYHCYERASGAFHRRVYVPQPINTEGIEAVLENGLLTIRLPKLQDRRGQATSIRVQYNDSETPTTVTAPIRTSREEDHHD